MQPFSSLPYAQLQGQQMQQMGRNVSANVDKISTHLTETIEGAEKSKKQEIIYQQALEACNTYINILSKVKEDAPKLFKEKNIANLITQVAKPVRGIDNTTYLMNMNALISKSIETAVNEVQTRGRNEQTASKIIEYIKSTGVDINPNEFTAGMMKSTGVSASEAEPFTKGFQQQKSRQAIANVPPQASPSQTFQESFAGGVGREEAATLASLRQGEEEENNKLIRNAVNANSKTYDSGSLFDDYTKSVELQNKIKQQMTETYGSEAKLREANPKEYTDYIRKMETLKINEKALLAAYKKAASKQYEQPTTSVPEAMKEEEQNVYRQKMNDINEVLGMMNNPKEQRIDTRFSGKYGQVFGKGDEIDQAAKYLREQYGLQVSKDTDGKWKTSPLEKPSGGGGTPQVSNDEAKIKAMAKMIKQYEAANNRGQLDAIAKRNNMSVEELIKKADLVLGTQ